jgi:pentapeptide repeat protein
MVSRVRRPREGTPRRHQGQALSSLGTINSARGSTGDGGRRDALQDLNDGNVSLVAAPLSQACLRGVKLPGATLSEAVLVEANLSGADLSGADLSGVNLREADLREADLRGTTLFEADLSEAVVGRFPLERPPDWLPSGWEVLDDKGTARHRAAGHRPHHSSGAMPIIRRLADCTTDRGCSIQFGQ